LAAAAGNSQRGGDEDALRRFDGVFRNVVAALFEPLVYPLPKGILPDDGRDCGFTLARLKELRREVVKVHFFTRGHHRNPAADVL